MSEVAQEGRTVLFVSHNMASIQALCPNGIVLATGRLGIKGNIEKCLSFYRNGKEEFNFADSWEKKGKFKTNALEINKVTCSLKW